MRANQYEVYQYLPKPFDLKDLISNVNSAIKTRSNPHSQYDLTIEPINKDENLPLVGSSSSMQTVYRLLSRLTNTSFNVLIEGKSGTGKNLAARVLHDFSERKNTAFLEINLSTVKPESLRELLYRSKDKNNFVGNGEHSLGTIFLDEVSDCSLPVQKVILEFLNEKEWKQRGTQEGKFTNLRIISSSKVNLKECIYNGSFREDLYFRLNEFTINLPLLEERLEDIPDLCVHFLDKFSKEGFKEMRLSQSSIDLIKKKKWSGNVRELKNFIGRLATLSTDGFIDQNLTKIELSNIKKDEFNTNDFDGSDISSSLERHISKYFDSLGRNLPAPGLYQTVLKEVEIPLISLTLSLCDGNQIKAASVLGINRNTLRKKIKDYDIVVTRGRKMM